MGVGAGLYMYDLVVITFTFAIPSPDEFLSELLSALSFRHEMSFRLTAILDVM